MLRSYLLTTTRSELSIAASRIIAPRRTFTLRRSATTDSAPEAAYPHASVMLQEVLDGFRGCNLQTYVDCTLGAGGHATALAMDHPEMRTLVGFDQDPHALAIASERLQKAKHAQLQVQLVNANYSELEKKLGAVPGESIMGKVDGILMDLGVSSMQIDQADRGFSFMQDGPLDMRMNPANVISAEEVLNTWPEAELGRIIREYGEEKMWKAVARRIVKAREEQRIQTTQQLVKAIGYTSITKDKKAKQIHPATRTFQAIRIAVNDELQQLEKVWQASHFRLFAPSYANVMQAIPQAIKCLAPGGRLGIISFHGLEDRIVKHAFLKAAGRSQTAEGPISFYSEPVPELNKPVAEVKLLNKKPLLPSDQEVQDNIRSRSAKLRFVQKL